MIEKPGCSQHGKKYMIHEDRQKHDYWICRKCEEEVSEDEV